MQPRSGKHQHQTRSYPVGSSQSSVSSYDSRQSTGNPNFYDDRRVINNYASLRITFSNSNGNQNTNQTANAARQSPETGRFIRWDSWVIILSIHLVSRFAENELNKYEEQDDDDDEDDREEEVINNLQNVRGELRAIYDVCLLFP